jgi:hypothetical protein
MTWLAPAQAELRSVIVIHQPGSLSLRFFAFEPGHSVSRSSVHFVAFAYAFDLETQ